MNKKLIIWGIAIVALLSSCSNKKQNVSLAIYADTASYFAERIENFESKAKSDMDNIDLYFQMEDSASAQKKIANEVLTKLFADVKDTLFLPFEQTKNFEKIKILSVWVTGMEFDKILLEARVEAIDNSSFMGPHAGLVIKDKDKKLLEVGGGIQGPTDEKLEAGSVYTFSGQIEHLHLLSDFKSIVFNEDIKMW